jgi:flagellar export protein FliJ
VARFRFRAQAALDLRVREHEAALRELARAESEQQRADAQLQLAARTLEEGKRTADAAVRTATSAADLQWYRFWIVRLDRERGVCAAAVQRQSEVVAAARSACLAARQRRESLERFRDKAQAASLEAEAATERKLIDELATRRFAVKAERA